MMGHWMTEWQHRATAAMRALTGQASSPHTGGRMLAGVTQHGGTAARRGTLELLSAYNEMPFLRMVVGRLAADIAAVPWQIWKPRRGGPPVRLRTVQRAAPLERHKAMRALEQVDDHVVLSLLDDFNSELTGVEGWRVTQSHIELAGEAFWLQERNALGKPAALWPIPPTWIVGTPTPGHPFFRASFSGWHGLIPRREIIWFRDPNPVNPYLRGSGIARSLGDELEAAEMAAKFASSSFRNQARPDIIVSPKGGTSMGADELARLEEDWNRRHQGFWRALRTYFIRTEVEIKELKPGNLREMQFTQLREFERDVVLNTYGLPPEMFGILTSSNRATITQARTIYGHVLVSRLELLRAVMQERLISQYDTPVLIDYVSPVPADQEHELNAGKLAPWSLNVDEHRARQGLEPLPNGAGRVFVVPSGHVVLPTLTGSTSRAVRSKSHKDDDAPESDDDEPAPTRLADRHVPAYRRVQEASWRALSRSANEAALTSAIGAGDVDAAIDAFGAERAIRAAYSEPLMQQAVPVFVAGAELASRSLPPSTVREPIAIDLTSMHPEATRWAEARAAQLVTAIGREARETLRTLIASATEGIPPAVLARRIVQQDLIGLLPRQARAVEQLRQRLREQGIADGVLTRRVARFSAAQLRKRAMLIARSELVTAVNAGQQALWQQAKVRGILPPGTKRVWLTTLDDAADEACLALSDVEVGLDEPFPGGIMHPPLHPACRCSVGTASVPLPAAASIERRRR